MKSFKVLAEDELKRQQKLLGKEILQKEKCPHLYVTIKINDVTWAIPLRSNIRNRPKITYCEMEQLESSVEGLDFTKAIIVNENSFSDLFVRISNRRRQYINKNYSNIEKRFKRYLEVAYKLKENDRLDIDPRTKYSTIKRLI